MKSITLLLGILMISSLGMAQKVAGVANAFNGKIVFIEANPKMQYRHIGTIVCSPFAPDKFELMIDHMLKRIEKEYPEVEYDAIIFRPGASLCKADVIRFFPDPDGKKKRGRGDDEVNPTFQQSETIGRNNLNLFVENTPTAATEVLGKIELPNNFESRAFDDIIREMVRVARETYPDLEGIIFVPGSGLRNAIVIKVKG